MPYPGVPSKYTKKMESCVHQVMAKNPKLDKGNAIAICKTQIVPKKGRSVGAMYTRPVLMPIRQVGDNRYRAYAVTFNGPDDKDLYDTYFDEATRYYLDLYTTLPWFYDHGLHQSVGRNKVGDWDEVGMDEQGVFVEGELLRHHKYREGIETLIHEGVLYPSSGTLSHIARVANDGHVQDWPVAEVSSTVRPGDWRMISAISPLARNAMRTILVDTIDNTEVTKMGKLKDELLELLGVRSEDAEPDEDKEEDDVNLSDTDADTTNDSGEDGGDEDKDTDDATLVRSVIDLVNKEFTTMRTAIQSVDAQVRAQGETLQHHSELLSGLAANETERVIRAVSDDDWVSNLYSVTQSPDQAPPATEGETEDAKKQRAKTDSDATGWELISGQAQ